jgi:hypothetical protein
MRKAGPPAYSDKRELIPHSNFAKDFNKEIARADGPKERQLSVTAPGDEVQMTLTVAALEPRWHETKTSKTSHPFRLRRDGAPR